MTRLGSVLVAAALLSWSSIAAATQKADYPGSEAAAARHYFYVGVMSPRALARYL
jgi:hypothetical protein